MKVSGQSVGLPWCYQESLNSMFFPLPVFSNVTLLVLRAEFPAVYVLPNESKCDPPHVRGMVGNWRRTVLNDAYADVKAS